MLAMLAILMRHIGFVRSACYLKYFSLHFPLHSTLVGEWIGRDADRGTQEKKNSDVTLILAVYGIRRAVQSYRVYGVNIVFE